MSNKLRHNVQYTVNNIKYLKKRVLRVEMEKKWVLCSVRRIIAMHRIVKWFNQVIPSPGQLLFHAWVFLKV